MLRLQLRDIGMPAPTLAAVAVPPGTSARGSSELGALVSAATGAAAVPVDAPLAAAIGAGLDLTAERPTLLLDVGAGTTQLAVIWEGCARAQERIAVGTRQYLDQPQRLVEQLPDVLRHLLDSRPSCR